MAKKTLLRSSKNKVIAGVCGGLGEYFELDPVLFRLLFVAVTLLGGSGVLIYIILWLVIPEDTSKGKDTEDTLKENASDMRRRRHRHL
jgi:phage shock protein C